MTVRVSDLKAVLKSAGISAGFNLYADEPSKWTHYLAIEKGRGNDAIEALTTAGFHAVWVPACSHLYADNIQVRRK